MPFSSENYQRNFSFLPFKIFRKISTRTSSVWRRRHWVFKSIRRNFVQRLLETSDLVWIFRANRRTAWSKPLVLVVEWGVLRFVFGKLMGFVFSKLFENLLNSNPKLFSYTVRVFRKNVNWRFSQVIENRFYSLFISFKRILNCFIALINSLSSRAHSDVTWWGQVYLYWLHSFNWCVEFVMRSLPLIGCWGGIPDIPLSGPASLSHQ